MKSNGQKTVKKAPASSGRTQLQKNWNKGVGIRRRPQRAPLAHNTFTAETLIGTADRMRLTFEEKTGKFRLYVDNHPPLIGSIKKAPHGIDQLGLVSESPSVKPVFLYIEDGVRLLSSKGTAFRTDLQHPSLKALVDAQRRVDEYWTERETAILPKALRANIVAAFQYQLLTGYVLHDSRTHSFILAYRNHLSAEPYKWMFCSGKTSKTKRGIHFIERANWGGEYLRATATTCGDHIELEFESMQVISCPIRPAAVDVARSIGNNAGVGQSDEDFSREDIARLRGEMPLGRPSKQKALH